MRNIKSETDIKKAMLCMSIVLSVVLMLSGCGKTQDASKNSDAVEQATAEELVEYLAEEIEFEDDMSMVDNDIFFGLFNIDADSVGDAEFYASTGATAEEVAVIKEANGQGDVLYEALLQRVETQNESYENYVPKELEKLEEPVIIRKGNTLIYVVCNEPAEAEKLIENYGNTEI